MITKMKKFLNIAIVLVISITVTSCFDKDRPNYQYMDNMYESVGYETYGEYDVFTNEQEAKLPADGSIKRGWQPYDYENTPEGKAAATADLENPLPYTEEHLGEGKKLYTIYCAVCHGDKGDGKGILAKREKILGVPAYNAAGRNITEGDVYHVMYYGINTMGSYASQTSEEERWQITHHVMKLKDALEGNPERETVEDTNSDNENMQPAEAEMAERDAIIDTENTTEQ